MVQYSTTNLVPFCLIAFLLTALVFERNRATKFEQAIDRIRSPFVTRIQQIEAVLPQQEIAAKKAKEKREAKNKKIRSTFPKDGFSMSMDRRRLTSSSAAEQCLHDSRQELEELRNELNHLLKE